ncbi:hypothetical protein JXA80_10155 [bacterium]|nr:hypothetical protein [candidate division CSSED10-310 bacterium]
MVIRKHIFTGWIMLMIGVLLVATGCDLYEDEEGDWSNDVTISVVNQSTCLVDFFIDGDSETSLDPGESFEVEGYGRGVHLLEAYPWYDEQFSCDSIYTPNLADGSLFEWTIGDAGECGECDPTPTPAPETPTPTPEP